jgi:ABC-2 type transport system permease protein
MLPETSTPTLAPEKATLTPAAPAQGERARRSLSLGEPSWRSHLLAMLAIAWKDWTIFFRYPLNAVLRVVEPIVWLSPIYFLGKSFAAPGGASGDAGSGFAAYTGTNDYFTFILIGVILSNYTMSVFWGIGLGLKNEMDAGVLESNWLAPVPHIVFLVGRTLASLAVTTLNNVLILLLAWLVFGFRFEGDIVAALAICVPYLVVLYGFGFAFCALVLLMRDANVLIDTSNYIVVLLSGAQFPVQALPRFLLPLALALPLTYGLDLARSFLLGTETLLPRPVEIAILVLAMAVTVPAGYGVFLLVERYCRSRGTLGMH